MQINQRDKQIKNNRYEVADDALCGKIERSFKKEVIEKTTTDGCISLGKLIYKLIILISKNVMKHCQRNMHAKNVLK